MMNLNELSPIAFPLVCFTAVCTSALIWIPFRSGRRPLALFDQSAAYAVLGVLGGYAADARGLELWLVGSLGLASGLLSYAAANHFLLRVGRTRSVSVWRSCALVFASCFAVTAVSVLLGDSLLKWHP